MNYITQLETKDLILGKARQEDLEAIYMNYWSSEISAQYMLWSPQKNLDEAQDRLNRTINYQKDNFAFFIYEKASNQPIGQVAMKEVEKGIWEDCGIGMGENFVGKGYGKQILTCIINYLFSELNAEKIICSCHPDNISSQKMQLSCGMKFTHFQPYTREKDNVTYMAMFHEITKDTWKNIK